MDECGYCKHMVPSGVDHYCKEELIEQITDVTNRLNQFYPKMLDSEPPLHLIIDAIEDDNDWNDRTQHYCENRNWEIE